MRKCPLGRTDILVSELCLGTMTWGSQNTEAEGHAQIDMALDHGVNFLDAAEMYPTTPLSADTFGRTEEILGSWLAKSGRRDEVVVATKVTGPGNDYIRGGAALSPAIIREAVEGSLRRLQTDVIDLFQLHWPNRGHYHFRKHWTYDPSESPKGTYRAEALAILETLGALVNEGKIRAIGLSNDTVWGTQVYLELAEAQGLPRMSTMQNEYSLLCRLYDQDFAELSYQEDVGLICYSPLATGILTGKYSAGAVPEGSRGAIKPGLSGRITDRSLAAADAYVALAQQHGLDPVVLALAFCTSRPFMTAPIFGATTEEHVRRAVAAADVTLSDEIHEAITAIHRQYPLPY